MQPQPGLFRFEQDEHTLVLTPTRNLSELELVSIDDTVHDVLQTFDANGVLNLVFDFGGTEYYGSTALGMFITLWKRVHESGGRMVFCNLSAHEQATLELTHLDQLWAICHSREDALAELS